MFSKLNLKGIPQLYTNSYSEACRQEKFTVNIFNNTYYKTSNCEFIWSKDYFGNSWNPLIDSLYGDIIVLKNKIVTAFIDLKGTLITSDEGLYGPINLRSILQYGTNPYLNDIEFTLDNFYYLCINNDGSKHIVVNKPIISNIFNGPKPCLMVTTSNREIDNSLSIYRKKFVGHKKPMYVAWNDYMGSLYFDKYALK